MRHLLTALIALAAAPAAAQGTYLQSNTLECAALEASVLYGVIDGSQESTASALTDLMGLNGGAACLAELESYGFGGWARDEDCTAAVELIRFEGARPRRGISPIEIVQRVLSDADATLCERMARREDDYEDVVQDGGDGSGSGSGSDGGSDGGVTG